MIIQPFGDRIVIKVLEYEEKSSTGLLVTPVSKNNSNRGEVMAVGEGITLSDGTIKSIGIEPGDIVLFSIGSGTNFTTSDEEYKIISSRDVLAKLIEKE